MNRSHALSVICNALAVAAAMTFLEWLMLFAIGVGNNFFNLLYIALGLGVATVIGIYLYINAVTTEIHTGKLLNSGHVVSTLEGFGTVFTPSPTKPVKPAVVKLLVGGPAVWTFLILLGILPQLVVMPLTIGYVLLALLMVVKFLLDDFMHGYTLNRIKLGTMLPSGEEVVFSNHDKQPRILCVTVALGGKQIYEMLPDTPELREELLQFRRNQLGILPDFVIRHRAARTSRKRG